MVRRTRAQHLELCRGCKRHVKKGTEICPHCGGSIHTMAKIYNQNLRKAKIAYHRLMSLVEPN